MTKSALPALAAALVASMALAGCNIGEDVPPDLPALFRIDLIRYWWEGDDLIVNVTFTNQHPTRTPGEGALDPHIYVGVYQEEVRDGGGSVGQETRSVTDAGGKKSMTLDFGTEYGNPWQKRWYRGTTTGPMKIPPGTTLSVEFGLTPEFYYDSEKDGYYYLLIDMTYWYPQSFYTHQFQDEEKARYYTGCFNRNVPEFYGVKKGAPDCRIWDCTGERTTEGYPFRDEKESYRAKCDATDATGPKYTN